MYRQKDFLRKENPEEMTMKPVFAFICGMFVVGSITLLFTPGARLQLSLPYWPIASFIALGFAILWARARENTR